MSDSEGLENPFSPKPSIPADIGEHKLREANRFSLLCWPSQKFIDLQWPKLDQIEITDIAHSLSILCRYNGHIRSFYSIAQHSLIVASMVPHTHRLAALLHDAEEAYIGDMSSPLKALYADLCPGFKSIGRRMRGAIFEKYDVDYRLYDDGIVKEADDRAYLMERNAFWRDTGAISFMEPATAERLFLLQFYSIKEGK